MTFTHTTAIEPATIAAQRAGREARLIAVQTALATGDQTTALCFEHARLLDELGHTDAARSAYLDVLRRDAAHAGALNELGRLLDRTGFHQAARTAFTQAVRAHPDDPIGHGNLATSLVDGGEIEAGRRHYEIALRLDPANVTAHACLAVLLLRLGEPGAAAEHGRIGFRQAARSWPYRGSGPPIPVLTIHSALGGNVGFERHLDDRIFKKSTIVAEFCDPSVALPPHALVVNAIGDADRCGAGLESAQALLARTAAPIINSPRAVRATGRLGNAQRLARIPGVLAPRVATFGRMRLAQPDGADDVEAAGFSWPLILRAPGFHTGRHCVLVAQREDLAAAAASMPGSDLLVIEYIDVRDHDGAYRKFRVMLVDGEILPLHLAVSRNWMVHYYTADMMNQAAYRAEDAAFLADMRGALGAPAVTALVDVSRALCLDYGGIDFGRDAAGRIIIFEANATMIAPPPPPDERWAYRRPAVERIDAAIRTMLLERAATTAH